MSRLRGARSALLRLLALGRVVVAAVPPTWLGLLVALGAWLVQRRFGQQRQDLVLLVVGQAMLGLVGVSWLAVGFGAVAARLGQRRLAANPEALLVEAEQPVRTGFALAGLGWLPIVSRDLAWVEPTAMDVRLLPSRRGRREEEIEARERGEHARIVRQLVIEDAFGFARVSFRFVEERRVRVSPARCRPPTLQLRQAMAGGDHVSHPLGPPDGDLVEMRRYGPSDPMKRVLWRTYARSRTLMVRTPERAVSPSRRTLVYLVAGEGDEPAASLARMALESGLLGAEWRFGADGGDAVAGDPQGALELIVRSRSARDRGGADFGRFLAQSERFGAGRVLIFAPARPGRWVEPVAAELARLGRSVEVVLGSDGIGASSPKSGLGRRLRRLLLRPTAADRAAAQPAALEGAVRRLAGAGAEVTIVDRRSGRRLDRRGHRRMAA